MLLFTNEDAWNVHMKHSGAAVSGAAFAISG